MNQMNAIDGRGISRLLLAIGLAVALGGCASTVRISDLTAAPQRYDGKTVRVEGTVTRSAGILDVGGYEIEDGTGRIAVRGVGCRRRDRGRACGDGSSRFTIAGRTVAAIVQEVSRLGEGAISRNPAPHAPAEFSDSAPLVSVLVVN